MKRLGWMIGVAAFAFAQPGHAAPLPWELASSADAFVASIGVCTHLTYGNTPYVKRYEDVKARLGELGVRNIRDGYSDRALDLYNNLGIGVSVIAEPDLGKPLPERVKDWEAAGGAISMIEGPNEPNLFWKRFNKQYKGQGWPAGLRMWQDDLYAAVKGDPALATIPVASPTPIFDGPLEAAPLTSFEFLALHPYAGGQMPSVAAAWNGPALRSALPLLGHDADMKPVVATESGYHNAIGNDAVLAGSQPGISEAAGGKYLPRHFAEFWRAGFARTYTYELLDERANPADPEANFGLLRNDLTPKPAFTALSNLIALLGESHWDRDKRTWIGPAPLARGVQVAIDAPSSVHHLLLSHADGTVDLLIWNEVSSFDLAKRENLTPPPAATTVRCASPSTAELYRPMSGRTPARTWAKSGSFAFEVPDELLMLRFRVPVPAKRPPASPTALAATATPSSATLSWRANDHSAAFAVTRLGRVLATIAPDAAGGGTVTDSGLTPGLRYVYTVSAIGPDGQLSAPATVTAATPNQRPDLIVKSLTWEPASPKPGDEVRFRAEIANTGNAPSPAVTHGVAFSVDGTVVNWSDTSHEPLAPGQSRSVTANNGPLGKGTWTCADGTFLVVAKVDDVNRIDESDKSNNTAKAVLTTGSGADLVVTSVRVDGDALAGKPVKLVGTVKNAGTRPTPEKVTVSCTFVAKDESGKAVSVGYGVLHRALGPGESADVPIERPWVPMAAGKYAVRGIADDVNRIAETNEANNASEAVTIEVK